MKVVLFLVLLVVIWVLSALVLEKVFEWWDDDWF